MNFSVGILHIFVKSLQTEILLLMTSSAAGTGMLVKRALMPMRLRFLLLDGWRDFDLHLQYKYHFYVHTFQTSRQLNLKIPAFKETQ